VELAEIAKEKKLEILNEEKEYLESVASAASNVLGRQIDDLEEARDNALKPYNEQIDNYEAQIKEIEKVIKTYEAQQKDLENLKKPLQEQLDLLDEEENREDKILAVQKAMYNLARAENQKNQLQYIGGQFVRTQNTSDVADARNELKEAELELQKFNIQEQIDAYDKQIEAIDEIIEGYNEQIDSINDVIDSINDLIDSTNDYYDKQVEALEKIQDEWEKIIDKYEEAIDLVNLKSMFGDDAVQRVLEGDVTLIQQFGQAYTDVLKEIDVTANGSAGEIVKQYAELANTDLSGISSQTKAVKGQFDSLNESVTNVSNSIFDSEDDGSSTLTGAMLESYDTATEVLPAESEMMDNLTLSTDTATKSVNELQKAIDELPTEKTITINVVTNGNIGGYASGTKNAKKGLNLVGEKEPEAVVTNDGNVFVAEKPTLLNMQGGETVYNGSETKELVNEGAKVLENGNLPDWLEPLPDDSPVAQLIKKMQSANFDASSIVPSSFVVNGFKSLTDSALGNVNNINNNQANITFGDINITCTGVTSQEVTKQIGAELQKTFSGMALKAYQRSKRTM
jgi:tetratricopeptide (TPR) repeat protein